jgi:hypothetical protein
VSLLFHHDDGDGSVSLIEHMQGWSPAVWLGLLATAVAILIIWRVPNLVWMYLFLAACATVVVVTLGLALFVDVGFLALLAWEAVIALIVSAMIFGDGPL